MPHAVLEHLGDDQTTRRKIRPAFVDGNFEKGSGDSLGALKISVWR